MSENVHVSVSASTRQSASSAQTGEVSAAGKRLRIGAWFAYGVLAIVYLGALLSPVRGLARFLTLEVIYTTPIALTVVLGAIAAKASSGAERRFWVFMSAANATLVACELLLVWWVLALDAQGPPRVSWPFHALHVVAALCFLGLVLSMSRLQDNQAASRWRIGLDIAAFAILAYIISLEFYARAIMGGAPVSAVLVGAGYPLVAFLLLFGTLGNVVGFKFVKWRSWEMLVAVSLAVYAVAISLWPAWYVTATDTSRNLTRGTLDMVQLTGHYLLLMAAVYRLTESTDWHLRPLPMPSAARNPWLGTVLPSASLLAIVVLLWTALSADASSAWASVHGALAVVLVSLMIGRSVLLTLEHGALFHRSVTDPLTGLFNHRYFHDHLHSEIQRSRRYDDELSVVVLDIDDFGGYNAVHGHLAGDRLLADLGAKLKEACGSSLICARLGGDEFGIIAPETDLTTARLLAQRILDVVGIECGNTPGTLSASAGVATYPEHASSSTELLRLADGALFRAKETGKARVVPFDAINVPDLSARERIERLERQSRLSAVRALAAAVDARDTATRFHSQQVAALSVEVSRSLGFSESRLRLVELAALLHDVGKIALPDAILNKTEKLSDDEWLELRQHSVRGEDILRATELNEIMPWVRGHHERWDGGGYPDGLRGAAIPLEARLLSVCDTYDAMTSDRTYRSALSAEAAAAELVASSGTQFDPRVVQALLDHLAPRQRQSGS